MARCETCGNEYDKAFEITAAGESHIFDSFECAIQAMAPECAHCGCKVIGHLTDLFDRKKLFFITLGLYLTATVATAAAFDFWSFAILRFLTGLGIGGEHAAINPAPDELLSARA